MKKEYIKPELESIDLSVKEAIMQDPIENLLKAEELYTSQTFDDFGLNDYAN